MKKLMILFLLPTVLFATEITVTTLDGDEFKLNVPPEASIYELKQMIQEATGLAGERLHFEGHVLRENEQVGDYGIPEFELECSINGLTYTDSPKTYSKAVHARDYWQKIGPSEQKNIRFMLRTLSNKPLLKLYSYRSQLEYAGDQIDHVHPLAFFKYACSDEELKVCLKNIRSRGKVWKEFSKNYHDSFAKEGKALNVQEEYLADFADVAGIPYDLLIGPYQKQDWIALMSIIIDKAPRLGDPGRYDM